MTTYTIWNGIIPSGTSQVATGARTDGILFTVSKACQLMAIAFYVPTGETTLTGSSYNGLLWSTTTGISGTLLGSQVGAGTWVASTWNWITLSTPIALSPSVNYVAGISSPDQLQYVHNYWSTGGPGASGLISGPINVPSTTTAPNSNQQGNAGAANTFPASSTGSWYGIDIQISMASTSGLLGVAIV
jgi:hypothetical protein